MKRDDFVFTIGYLGDKAIVDRSLRRTYSGAGVSKLVDAGLYRQAFCAAVFDQDQDEMAGFLRSFSEKIGTAVSEEQAKRLFGVFSAPEDDLKVILL